MITGLVVLAAEAFEITPFAHITLLAPFGRDNEPTPEEVEEAAGFFADVTPFAYTLTDVSTFPDGTCYLAPEPASHFSRLTHRLHHLFPEYPPYKGRFDLVVPHLTVPPDANVAAVAGLPITAYAAEAALLQWDGEYRVLDTFPFGTTAA